MAEHTSAGIAKFRSFVESAADLVLAHGGSLSGEHGDGQARGELLAKMFGPELVGAFREFKTLWDPDGRMNPGKVVDAYPLDAHLRLGTSYRPPALRTHFAYPDDRGGFAGMAPARAIPRLAAEPFQRWYSRRGTSRGTNLKVGPTGKRVVLWPDTFNNYFHPDTARAAVDVLEAAGFDVVVPSGALCCGRPLYDYGMLDAARALLRATLAVLERELRDGTPIVVLEPSCAAVFRDELRGLFPLDRDAERLRSQTLLLSELLVRHARPWRSAPVGRRAILHGHCHQKSILGMTAEEQVLAQSGVAFETLDSGCCGMAGAFGFERGHYDISIAIGERVLLPAVRAAAADTLIVADGFSCREQIAQATGRQALHLADVLRMGLRTP